MRHGPQRAIHDAVVVLTGASSGIGRATARQLAGRGANLSLAARSEEDLREVAEECTTSGADVLATPTDVSDEDDVRALADRTLERFGRIDVWINDAAVMAYGEFDDIPADTFRQVIETNLFGTIHGSRAAIPAFRSAGSGTLVNVASLYAKLTSPYVTPYVTSKYAVLGFSRCVREELATDRDIHVCVVLPEAVDTPIFEHAANYTGREITALPPAMEPQRVVDAILGCIERPRPEVTVGVTGRAMTFGQRALRRLAVPRLYDRLANRAMQLVGLRDQPSRDTDGNVFEPDVQGNRVDGGWRRQRRTARRLAAAALATSLAAPLLARWRSRRSG